MITNDTNKNLFDLIAATHALAQEPLTETQEINLTVSNTTFDVTIGRHFVSITVATAERSRTHFLSTDNFDWKRTLQAWLVLTQGIFNGIMDEPAEIAPTWVGDLPTGEFSDSMSGHCPCGPGEPCPDCDGANDDFINRDTHDGHSRMSDDWGVGG